MHGYSSNNSVYADLVYLQSLDTFHVESFHQPQYLQWCLQPHRVLNSKNYSSQQLVVKNTLSKVQEHCALSSLSSLRAAIIDYHPSARLHHQIFSNNFILTTAHFIPTQIYLTTYSNLSNLMFYQVLQCCFDSE